ncbi:MULTISPECIES: ParA family protein [Lactococcus]|uniref:ParA family protein n=1 Tax=Lactococcus TaxID=1357 RepID=UPI00203C7B26|nr:MULTISPECIES: AAA family ATPase [Lactococcus]
MRIISISAVKGGVGKTTITFNYGEWLSSQGYNVLLIDTDHQCSLSQTYNLFTNEETIYNAFVNKDVNIHQIHQNLSIIPASPMLDELEVELSKKHNKDLLLMMWLEDNVDRIKDFDFILIDCHPDFQTVTRNAIAVSHYIISPIEPSQYGYMSKSLLLERLENFRDEVIDARTRETYISALPYFIGNRIRHNTKSSREFSDKISQDKGTIAMIPEKELFNRSTLDGIPLVQMEKDKDVAKTNKAFFEKLNSAFEQITEKVSE